MGNKMLGTIMKGKITELKNGMIKSVLKRWVDK